MLLLAALPFGTQTGLVVATLGTLGLLALVVFSSPTITVDSALRVSRIQIPLTAIGSTEQLDKEQLRKVIGPLADARSQLFIRGYINTALRVEITDPQDPTPYFVISTRRPAELAVALFANRS
ncbi:MAG: DUF3093 domain-containing protein [Aquiluna sp.]